MNLHISAASSFIDAFHRNLTELYIANNNKIVLRSGKKQSNFQSANLYSNTFDKIVGDTRQYEKVFIHQFSPLMYRWVATHDFKEVNWMVWGADLYSLPEFEYRFYETITKSYVKSRWSLDDFLYKAKLFTTNSFFRRKAYSKVKGVYTWMNNEFLFAQSNLPLNQAKHSFFFYENQTPYPQIRVPETQSDSAERGIPVYIVGNSGVATNNHLDTLDFLAANSINAKLLIPVSYGDAEYVKYLKRNTHIYKNGPVEFIDSYMSFHEYVSFLNSADGLIMNTLRPQGYGNIFMMMCLNKPVYMNAKNISRLDLIEHGIHCLSLDDLKSVSTGSLKSSKDSIISLMSHEKLCSLYREYFS